MSKCHTNEDGTEVALPRLTANYGERSYNYSGLVFVPEPWTPLLLPLKEVAESLTGESFNALICQLYRDGQDGVGWHADNDPCVAERTTLVSMSFGTTRDFCVRHKTQHDERYRWTLQSGDILVMRDDLQMHYVHKIPKDKTCQKPRINLTFRQVLATPRPQTT